MLANAYIEKKLELGIALEEIAEYFHGDLKAIEKNTFYKRAKLAVSSKKLGIYVQTRAINKPGLKQKEVAYLWLCGCSPDNVRTKFIGDPTVINVSKKAVKAFLTDYRSRPNLAQVENLS